MSNRIDFFQAEQKGLAIPAATVSVFLDGQLCPSLVPIEMVRGGWPEFSWARLTLNRAGWAEVGQADEPDLTCGRSICIRQFYNAMPPDVAVEGVPIFAGHIETIERDSELPGEQGVRIVARDFSAELERITVYGQRHAGAGGSGVFLAGLDTIFNPNGRANASAEPVSIDGKTYTVFAAESPQGQVWSYAQAIQYLLCEYLPTGRLQIPSVNQLESVTENQIVRDLDVTGLSLLAALRRCCERIGLEFKFVPRLAETGPSEAIVFYGRASGRQVELSCQAIGEVLSVSKTNVAKVRSRTNFWPVTHRYIGQGDFKVYEATFELVKAWDPAIQSTNYDTFSPSTNPQFYQVKDVYRKWCLNEAGDYSGPPYNRGAAFDFSKIFGTTDYAQRRRRFWPCLSADKQGKSLGYYLQVSFDGENWWQYLYAFNNLLDECGIWLSSDQLDLDTWIAALKGVLRFRITASVVSDERLGCAVTNGPVNSVAPVMDYVITVPRQFKYRKVSGQSIFAGGCGGTLGIPDEVDDSQGLYEFVRHKTELSGHIVETAEVQMPYLALDLAVGDRMTAGPDSRDILSLRTDNRSLARIERVQMDFVKQNTSLKIVRQRM
jgi:hypothetical protein